MFRWQKLDKVNGEIVVTNLTLSKNEPTVKKTVVKFNDSDREEFFRKMKGVPCRKYILKELSNHVCYGETTHKFMVKGVVVEFNLKITTIPLKEKETLPKSMVLTENYELDRLNKYSMLIGRCKQTLCDRHGVAIEVGKETRVPITMREGVKFDEHHQMKYIYVVFVNGEFSHVIDNYMNCDLIQFRKRHKNTFWKFRPIKE